MKFKYLILMLLLSCNGYTFYDKEEIKSMINSKDADSTVKGFFIIGEKRDTSFINDIFKNANDPRLSIALEFKGMSIYQEKMIAMKKITQIQPPTVITRDPDSSIILFYYKIAQNRGWIK